MAILKCRHPKLLAKIKPLKRGGAFYVLKAERSKV